MSPFYARVRRIHIAIIWEGTADAGFVECTKRCYQFRHYKQVRKGRACLEAILENFTGGTLEEVRRSFEGGSLSVPRGSSAVVLSGRRRGRAGRSETRGRRMLTCPRDGIVSETSVSSVSDGRAVSRFGQVWRKRWVYCSAVCNFMTQG